MQLVYQSNGTLCFDLFSDLFGVVQPDMGLDGVPVCLVGAGVYRPRGPTKEKYDQFIENKSLRRSIQRCTSLQQTAGAREYLLQLAGRGIKGTQKKICIAGWRNSKGDTRVMATSDICMNLISFVSRTSTHRCI